MARTSINQRVQKHRDTLRMAGLRPIQLWVPDTRKADFAEECRRQSLIAAQADASQPEMNDLLEEALSDIDGWTSE